nr:hypothetical protein [Tanacetum cinerariifolium]
LVTQGHTQEEGIDYEKVFAPVARIKAIRGSVHKLHIYRRPILDDYKKGKKINDLQLITFGDMFMDYNSYLKSREALKILFHSGR